VASVDDVACHPVVVSSTNQVIGAVGTQDHHQIGVALQGSDFIMDDDASEDVILVDLSASGLIGVVLSGKVLGGDAECDGLLKAVVG
jgi:hypothetical protein